MMKIIHTNCSEQSFALTGTLKAIKKEILKMLDCVEKEYKEDEKNKKLSLTQKKMFANARISVDVCKTIDELENVCFNFTCNYATYFSVEDDNTLLVATCNNHEWSGVNYSDTNKEYYEIINGNKVKEVMRYEEFLVVEDNKKKMFFQLPHKESPIYNMDDGEREIKLKQRRKEYLLNTGGNLIPLKQLEREDLPEKLQQALVEDEI